MLIIFTVKDQKVTHDLGSKDLVAESIGVVQAAFTFDSIWDGLDKIVVFTNTNKKCISPKPVRYEGEPIDIPTEALKAGKLYVSVIGYGSDGLRLTTRAWDIQQAITVQECGAMGGCDLLRNMATGGTVSDDNVATDNEVEDMLDDVFGDDDTGGGTETPDTPSVSEDDVATDAEVQEMLEEVFSAE